MQTHIDEQGTRIQKFNESMKRVSAAAAAAAAQDDIILQLQRDIADKDTQIKTLLSKFHSGVGGGGGGGGGGACVRTPRVSGALRAVKDIMTGPANNSLPDSSSLSRGKVALEQLDFLAKVFEQELGIVESSLSHESNIWAAAHGQNVFPKARPSPVVAPDKLQAMLAVENQAPPPCLDAAPSSRPLFLARRLRPATPPPPPVTETHSLGTAQMLVSLCETFGPFLRPVASLFYQPVLTAKTIAPLVCSAALRFSACP
jgi:hypothetical protein